RLIPTGPVALAVLQRDFRQCLPERACVGPLDNLDVGAGPGHMSKWLLRQGHQLTISEPSPEMLEAARARLQAVEISAPPWQALDLPLQGLPERGQRHDLVICHAVLEWLADPAAALADLRALVRPGGAQIGRAHV